jgi:hypothetical protein
MKKAFIIFLLSLFVVSCGGSNESKPVEATYAPVGVDSSNILPPLTDSAKIELNGEKPKPQLNEN